MLSWRFIILVAILLSTAEVAFSAKCRQGNLISKARVQNLQERLVTADFKKKFLKKVFVGTRLCRTKQAINFNVFNPERAIHYRQFTEAYAIRIARGFLRKQRITLAKAEKRYHVPAETITAILLVETAFGRAKLPYLAFDVFVSLAVIDPRGDAISYLNNFRTHYPNLERKWLQARLEQKSRFGYEQLVALLEINRSTPEQVRRTYGSYAGALGIPQFLPTSQLQWGVDGNQDGTINLYQISDAIHSVAYYLSQHGWERSASPAQQGRAIWAYNRSSDYVKTIQKIASILANKNKRRR